MNGGSPKYLIYNGKSQSKMDDFFGIFRGTPHFRKPPFQNVLDKCGTPNIFKIYVAQNLF
jgi:hypothetical protein